MKLSDLTRFSDIEVKEEGEFESLGIITHKNPQQLTFLESEKFLKILKNNQNISCVITKNDLLHELTPRYGVAVSNNPRKSFFLIHNYLAKTNFYGKTVESSISEKSYIHPNAWIAENNVNVGDNCYIDSNVSILEGSILEEGVIVRSGTVIGGEGFYFIRSENDIIPVIHAGGIIIHNNVEIQSNCCFDKATFGCYTEIGEKSKFDNLVHVAHNVKIGKRCLIAANVMIAGSTSIGDDVWIGPSAAISSEINIGNNAMITLGSVVTKDVEAYQKVTGNFAIEHDKFIKFIKSIR